MFLVAVGPSNRDMTRRAVIAAVLTGLAAFASENSLSPSSIVSSRDGQTLYIAAATGRKVLRCSATTQESASCAFESGAPSGLVLSPEEGELFVTVAAPESFVAVVDPATLKEIRRFHAGHTATAPVLSPDGRILYICNRFNNEVAFLDAESGRAISKVAVDREPVAQALTPDGKHLIVANHIHKGRADLDVVASSVSIIDVRKAEVVKRLGLPNGSGLLRGVAVSPDGKYACVTHLLSRFHLPTTQIERGWINTSALTLIDLQKLEQINTVLLDNIDRGAANPWATQWSADGKNILVTHAGTHEVSVIDAAALLKKLAAMPKVQEPGAKIDYTVASHVVSDVPNDLSFLVGLRQRVRLPQNDRGPRAITLVGSRAIVANYFSDSLSDFDFCADRPKVQSIKLQLCGQISLARQGEFYFNDASICFQGWQSCASCHSSDARVDGLNWDNLNDGIGNPKNAKSLLLAHLTPPSMWLGVRSNAYVAVRAGIKNSLFTIQPEHVAQAIDEYLKSLRPEPSPYLVNGKLSPAAERGERLFFSEAIGCSECHSGPLRTDMKFHDVGTRGRYDKATDRFDTPSLVEIWRSAPYLHDGSAATIEDVLTTANSEGKHGETKQLSTEQLTDLVAYVLSL